MALMILTMTIQALMLTITIQAGETGAVTIYSGAIWALVLIIIIAHFSFTSPIPFPSASKSTFHPCSEASL